MLITQKIKVGEVNEINLTGRFIKILDCTGELDIAIFKGGRKIIDTMALSNFEFINAEFDKITVMAAVNQQYRMWVSEYRMAYNPLKSTSVGSAGLKSSSKSVAFGEPQLLAAEDAGRKAITINAAKPIKIGGYGVGVSSAVGIPANTPFKLETQAAIYAFSEDKDDSIRVLTDLSGDIQETHTIEKGGNKLGIFYNPIKKYTYMINHTGLRAGLHLLNEHTLDMSSKLTEVHGDSVSLIDTGDFIGVSPSNAQNVVLINGDTFVQTVRGTVGYSISFLGVTKTGKWVALDYGLSNAKSYNGELIETIEPPSMVKPKVIVSVGERVLLFGENSCALTDDCGVTWTYTTLPESLKGSTINFNVVVDELTGDVLYTGAEGNIWISKNKGLSFEPKFLVSDGGVLGCAAMGGAYAAITMSKIYYESGSGSGVVNNGGIWFPTGTIKSLSFSNTGHLVVGENEKWRFWSTDEYIEVGGAMVALLSEVN